MRPLITVLLSLPAAWLPIPAAAGYFTGPENYHECILDRLDGVNDNATAVNLVVQCRDEFNPLNPEQPPSPWFFEPQNVKECLEEHLAKPASPFAVGQIQDACLMYYPDSGETSQLPGSAGSP